MASLMIVGLGWACLLISRKWISWSWYNQNIWLYYNRGWTPGTQRWESKSEDRLLRWPSTTSSTPTSTWSSSCDRSLCFPASSFLVYPRRKFFPQVGKFAIVRRPKLHAQRGNKPFRNKTNTKTQKYREIHKYKFTTLCILLEWGGIAISFMIEKALIYQKQDLIKSPFVCWSESSQLFQSSSSINCLQLPRSKR